MRVTVLDRHNHHLFQPLLYQVATATLSPGDIASPIRWILRHAAQHARAARRRAGDRSGEASHSSLEDESSIDVRLSDRRDGTSHTYFGHDEWACDAPGLKTLEDALEIRRRICWRSSSAERETDPARQQRAADVRDRRRRPDRRRAGRRARRDRATDAAPEFRNIDTHITRIVLVEAGPTILPSFAPRLRDAARDRSRGWASRCGKTRASPLSTPAA